MTTTKSLGIWMDHASAHVMELGETMMTSVITSTFTHSEKEKSSAKSENLMHNKEQGRQSEYYKRLSAIIKTYDDVLLFGPTDAKAELRNLLKADRAYDNIKMVTQPAEKMTENQEHAFVKAHFTKPLKKLL